MFGSSKRHVFKPTAYGTTRRSRRIPRWLVLMLTGVVLGAGGLLFLQKSYGPQRLTVEQSEQLHYDLNSLNMDKQRLQSELNHQTRELADAKARLASQEKQLAQARETVETQKKDILMFAAAMPPDPRGTSPGIRAASFHNQDGQLVYDVLLMQDEKKASRFAGNAEMIVAGTYSNGRAGNINLPPIDLSLERYTQLSGQADMPQGFRPRQVAIKIRSEGSPKVVATRTLIVQR
ncbi:DUF6776 family protein [Allopusillimonas ginsengisoli]|uniref:DUF6776 family protein n=1 Tax=Allopusillimonas ginsengisoli TaxID=453575 RepID=UPI001021914A|nr:DUF6776 family protein [Allopusillimonas ginsengisoli]TEA80210.1 hypothetical protein ERE07_04670 [Allopusillimonas ginsengisoli]